MFGFRRTLFGQLFEQVLGQQVAFRKRAQDRLPQRLHCFFRIKFGEPVILRLETALQEKVAQPLDQFFEINGVGRLTRVP